MLLVEEGGAIEGKDKTHRFIIDPIRWHSNFMHGIPQFAISIALEREGHLVSALVFNSVDRRNVCRRKSHGAYLNDRRLRVAGRKGPLGYPRGIGRAVPGQRRARRIPQELEAIIASTAGVRRSAPPRSISPGWRRDASMRSGSAI